MSPSPSWMTGILLLLALSPYEARGQPSEIPRSGTYTITTRDGSDRTFRVHLPRGYSATGAAKPLVLMFHGWGGNENEFLDAKIVTSVADQRGYILVAPRGLGSNEGEPNSWTFGSYPADKTTPKPGSTAFGSATGLDGDGEHICDDRITPDYRYQSCTGLYRDSLNITCSWTHCQADDVQFILELIAYLTNQLNVDKRRIYAMGGSNGGMFTWELGQNSASAGLFRAIAPLIGLPHRGYLSAAGNGGILPVLLITGTRDKVVPPGDWEAPVYTTTANGSDRYYYTGATAITRIWAQAHGCNINNPAIAFDDGVRDTDCRSYCPPSGDEWPEVLDCRARMGHSYSLSWSWKLILDFFDHHSD